MKILIPLNKRKMYINVSGVYLYCFFSLRYKGML